MSVKSLDSYKDRGDPSGSLLQDESVGTSKSTDGVAKPEKNLAGRPTVG